VTVTLTHLLLAAIVTCLYTTWPLITTFACIAHTSGNEAEESGDSNLLLSPRQHRLHVGRAEQLDPEDGFTRLDCSIRPKRDLRIYTLFATDTNASLDNGMASPVYQAYQQAMAWMPTLQSYEEYLGTSAAYYTAYRGLVRNQDGSFGGFVREAHPVHWIGGYWRFRYKHDEQRAHARGIWEPEQILLATEQGDANYEDIEIRWMRGYNDPNAIMALAGTASSHLHAINEIRRLLGWPLSSRGHIPIYPSGTDMRLKQYWDAQYALLHPQPPVASTPVAPTVPTHNGVPEPPPSATPSGFPTSVLVRDQVPLDRSPELARETASPGSAEQVEYSDYWETDSLGTYTERNADALAEAEAPEDDVSAPVRTVVHLLTDLDAPTNVNVPAVADASTNLEVSTSDDAPAADTNVPSAIHVLIRAATNTDVEGLINDAHTHAEDVGQANPSIQPDIPTTNPIIATSANASAESKLPTEAKAFACTMTPTDASVSSAVHVPTKAKPFTCTKVNTAVVSEPLRIYMDNLKNLPCMDCGESDLHTVHCHLGSKYLCDLCSDIVNIIETSNPKTTLRCSTTACWRMLLSILIPAHGRPTLTNSQRENPRVLRRRSEEWRRLYATRTVIETTPNFTIYQTI